MTKPKSKKQVLIGNFFKRKYEEINDDDTTPNETTPPNVDVDSSPNVDQANDDVDAIPNVDQANDDLNDNPTTSIPTTRGIIDLNDLPSDPFDRPPIASYHPNQIDDIRRSYLVKGAFQPRSHKFPVKDCYEKKRRFVVSWFNNCSWLEYSIKADKVYCLYCYLFKEDVGNQGGRDTWSSSSKGFSDWSKKGSLKEHVGNVDSHHSKAAQKCHNLMNQKKHMDENMKKLTKEEMIANYYRLLGSVMSARFCLENSLPFRGHDESEESNSQGMFLSVLNLISTNHPEIGKYTLGNVKKNNKLTSSKIQKEIIECFSKEVTKSICAQIKDDVFDPSKILAFAKMYPDDFTTQEIGSLLGDIESFRHTISDDDNFEELNGIRDLARVMVETGTHSSCPTVYRVVKLALLLPVATATVERCFSKLKLVKTDLRNRIGPEFLNNAMVCAVEKDFLSEVKDDDVMERFQAMKKKEDKSIRYFFTLFYVLLFFLILYDCTVKKIFFGIPLNFCSSSATVGDGVGKTISRLCRGLKFKVWLPPPRFYIF
ncbi:putative transcription factor and/or regulators TTF-type(Zn) family [Helianthus annuus]|nr:putative transcription factor and/or regulators TTF-type(Zn) family [Helianthus annuus]